MAKTFTVSDELAGKIAFALAIFVEDQEMVIKKAVKDKSLMADFLKERSAAIEKFRLLALAPNSLTGKLTLATGEVIKPGQPWTE